MIRINLLAVERERPRRRAALGAAQKITIAASVILVATALGILWWFWSLGQQSARVDQEILDAEAETRRLQSVLMQVQQFEARKAQLQQRVTLIEELRKGQNGPVHMLDAISRSLPDRLWLIELTQNQAEVTIRGVATSLTALSDFVGNLEGSGYFKRPVEIVSSQVETTQAAGDLVRFLVRGQFEVPEMSR